jgi:leucine-rich repeat kinase 2
MRCTGGAMIPQEQLVPDLLLANVDQQYIVDESDLIIEENPQSMLGEGGFGSVYRAKYKNKNVAVKVGFAFFNY